jgi:hypothetical protein
VVIDGVVPLPAWYAGERSVKFLESPYSHSGFRQHVEHTE